MDQGDVAAGPQGNFGIGGDFTPLGAGTLMLERSTALIVFSAFAGVMFALVRFSVMAYR